MGSWDHGIMGLWDYGIMGLWDYGIMGLWDYFLKSLLRFPTHNYGVKSDQLLNDEVKAHIPKISPRSSCMKPVAQSRNPIVET